MSGSGTFIAVAMVLGFGFAYATNMLSRFGLPCKPPFCLGQQADANSYDSSGNSYGSSPSYGGGGGKGGYGGGTPGWYTAGPQGSGHHHCQAYTAGCYCTDPCKCVGRRGTGANLCTGGQCAPKAPGQCAPQFGTSTYLGAGGYPATADYSCCPPGTT